MMAHDQEYGFRYDPMEWLKSDSSLEGAFVRTRVFHQPQDGDEEKLTAKIGEILAEQRDDGSFGEHSKDTGDKLLDLLEHGASHDRPEVRRAAEAVLRQMRAGHNANEWRVTAEMNEAGCCAYNDPWGFTDAAGRIDTPEARALIAKQIPLILRGQKPDGGWGRVSRFALTCRRQRGAPDRD